MEIEYYTTSFDVEMVSIIDGESMTQMPKSVYDEQQKALKDAAN